MDVLGLKSWLLGHAVVILGVALGLTVGYASWIRCVTIPSLKKDVEIAQANEALAKANVQTCVSTNASLSQSVDTCNRSVKLLADDGDRRRQDSAAILAALGLVGKDVKKNLQSYKPNPNKSDCENALSELAAFKADRGR